MISSISVSLRAWHPLGNPFSAVEFVDAISTDSSKLNLVGSGQQWETARILGFELLLKAYQDAAEPHEAFDSAMRDSFIEFSKWLGTVTLHSLDLLRSRGMNLDLFVSCWIDQDQFEVQLPSELLGEAGRLKLAIKVISND